MSAVDALVSAQNPDGGWSFVRGASWTEPTALAVLALRAHGERAAAARGAAWIRARQQADGGFAPSAAVEESTWVTALALLVPDAASRRDAAIDWVLESAPSVGVLAEAAMLVRGREFRSYWKGGWSYFGGTSGWNYPTALTVVALRAVPRASERVEAARHYLLSRISDDGGWNYGIPLNPGRSRDSYPETTGAALVGLKGVQDKKLVASLDRAGKMLTACRSCEGVSWLRMGLRAHGRPAEAVPATPRNPRDTALALLADAERNPLL